MQFSCKRLAFSWSMLAALLLPQAPLHAETSVADQVIQQLESSGALDKAVERVLDRMRQQQIAAQQAQAEKAAAQKLELAKKARVVDPKTDIIFGKADAVVSVIEYSDFECPYCKQFADVPFQVIKDFPDQVNLVWRHFPLPFHDPMATKEAVAATCAAQQGGNDAFWKFSDAIFKGTRGNGQGLPGAAGDDPMMALARAQALDLDRFKACIASENSRNLVAADLQDGVGAGINGTPGVILVNHKTGAINVMPGAVPVEVLRSAVDELLKQ